MHAQASVTDPSALEGLVRGRRPEVVFNCAAYNEVDRAEEERDAAFAINEAGGGRLKDGKHLYNAVSASEKMTSPFAIFGDEEIRFLPRLRRERVMQRTFQFNDAARR